MRLTGQGRKVMAGLAGLLLLVWASPVSAVGIGGEQVEASEDGVTQAECFFEGEARTEPGLGMEPVEGETWYEGAIRCIGMVKGHTLTGEEGAIRWHLTMGTDGIGSYVQGGQTCAAGGGRGIVEVDLVTTDGKSVGMRGSMLWHHAGVVVPLVFEFFEDGVLGLGHIIAFIPDEDEDGNCVEESIEEFTEYGRVTLSG